MTNQATTEISEQQRQAEFWALADDENLEHLLAWRLVRARSEEGGFNGLILSDLTRARAALKDMLSPHPG